MTTTDMGSAGSPWADRSGPQRGEDALVLADPVEDPRQRFAWCLAGRPLGVRGDPSVVGHVDTDVSRAVLRAALDLHSVPRDLLAQDGRLGQREARSEPAAGVVRAPRGCLDAVELPDDEIAEILDVHEVSYLLSAPPVSDVAERAFEI